MKHQLLGKPSFDVAMSGLEADSLLALLALLGLLRSLERARPRWNPRASWAGPPWEARLHLAERAERAEIAVAATEGVEAIAGRFDVDGRNNVSFSRDDYRRYAERVRGDDVGAAIAAALCAELPQKRAGGLQPGPFVLLFGQGHQNFLDRLVAVPRGDLPNRHRKLKTPPNMRDPHKLEEALFEPWKRADDADAFRWDPAEDQRYALRYDDPSAAGAAPTVHGANRLAAIGFLSFASLPRSDRAAAIGTARTREGSAFVWPLWVKPLGRRGIEALISHRDVIAGRLERVATYGVREILRARRISNGKFVNVTRATAFTAASARAERASQR